MAEEPEGAGEHAQHAAGGLKGLLTHKLGPLPAWVWGLGLVGTYLVYRYYKNAAANSPQTQAGTLAVNPALSAGSGGGGGGTPSPDYSTAINGLLADVQAQQASLTNQGNALSGIQTALQQEQQAFSELQAGNAPQASIPPPPSTPPLPAPTYTPPPALPPPTYAPAAQFTPVASIPAPAPAPVYSPLPASGAGLGYLGVPLGTPEGGVGYGVAAAPLAIPQAVPGSIPFPSGLGVLSGLPSGIVSAVPGTLPFIPAPPPPTSFPVGTTIGPSQAGNTGAGAYVTLPNGEQIWQPYGAPPVI